MKNTAQCIAFILKLFPAMVKMALYMKGFFDIFQGFVLSLLHSMFGVSWRGGVGWWFSLFTSWRSKWNWDKRRLLCDQKHNAIMYLYYRREGSDLPGPELGWEGGVLTQKSLASACSTDEHLTSHKEKMSFWSTWCGVDRTFGATFHSLVSSLKGTWKDVGTAMPHLVSHYTCTSTVRQARGAHSFDHKGERISLCITPHTRTRATPSSLTPAVISSTPPSTTPGWMLPITFGLSISGNRMRRDSSSAARSLSIFVDSRSSKNNDSRPESSPAHPPPLIGVISALPDPRPQIMHLHSEHVRKKLWRFPILLCTYNREHYPPSFLSSRTSGDTPRPGGAPGNETSLPIGYGQSRHTPLTAVMPSTNTCTPP